MAMAPGMGKGDPRAAIRKLKEAMTELAESDFTGFGWHDELLDFGDDLFEAERMLHPRWEKTQKGPGSMNSPSNAATTTP